MIRASREAVVDEAMSWIGTRYHHAARVKAVRDAGGRIIDRGGVDCATLLAEIYGGLGLVQNLAVPSYPHDWHMHRRSERYLQVVREHATEIDRADAAPGDVVMFHFGHTFSHAGVLVRPGYPHMVHAFHMARAVTLDRADAGPCATVAQRFFTLWAC